MSEIETAAQNIYTRLSNAPTYHPANASLFTDWNIQAGDIVTVESGEETYSVPICSMKLKWTGQSKVDIESTGNPERQQPTARVRRDYRAESGAYKGQKDLERKTTYVDGILYDAGLFVDPVSGVWAYAGEQGSDYALGSTFNTQAGRIQAEVTRATAAEGALSARVTLTEQGLTSKVSAGDIASTINQTAQSVLISASKIDLDGYVTADELGALIADIASLTVQDIAAGQIDCDGVEAGTLLANTDLTSAGTLSVSGNSTLADVDAQDVAVSTLSIDGYAVDPANLVASFGTNTGSGGQISIPVYMADGSEGSPITFNIAATQYYQQGVAAARLEGYNVGYMDARPESISPALITLTSAQTGISTRDLDVTQHDGTIEPFTLQVDASAVYAAGRSSVTQRTAVGASAITLAAADTGTSNKTTTVLYSDSTSTANVPIQINASNVYAQGYTVGEASVTLSGSWNTSTRTYTATASNGQTVSTTLGVTYVYPRGNSVTLSNYTRVSVTVPNQSYRVPVSWTLRTIVDEDGYVWRNVATGITWGNLWDTKSLYYFEDDGTESTYYQGASRQTYYTIPS